MREKNRICFSRVTYLWLALLLIHIAGCESTEQIQQVNFEKTISDSDLSQTPSKENGATYFFGFDVRISPQEDARQYLPFLRYLENTTNQSFELRFTPSETNIVDMLGKGELHFAAIGADTYIQAHRRYGVIPLTRGLNSKGKAEYQSAIVIAPDSPIVTVGSLRGKRFAFGSQTSTQGHLIPRILLAQKNIYLDDLASYVYTGSHGKCANAVTTGTYDACGMQDTLAKDLEKSGLIKILYMSQYYPSSGIAANKEVGADLLAKVQKALVTFQPKGKHAASLYNWEKTEMPNGFVVSKDNDYKELRDWVVKLGY